MKEKAPVDLYSKGKQWQLKTDLETRRRMFFFLEEWKDYTGIAWQPPGINLVCPRDRLSNVVCFNSSGRAVMCYSITLKETTSNVCFLERNAEMKKRP